VLDGQRGEVRAGNQGADGLSSGQKPGKNFPVTFGGKDERGNRDGKPTVDDGGAWVIWRGRLTARGFVVIRRNARRVGQRFSGSDPPILPAFPFRQASSPGCQAQLLLSCTGDGSY